MSRSNTQSYKRKIFFYEMISLISIYVYEIEIFIKMFKFD